MKLDIAVNNMMPIGIFSSLLYHRTDVEGGQDFVHDTFRDFFAGYYLAQMMNRKMLAINDYISMFSRYFSIDDAPKPIPSHARYYTASDGRRSCVYREGSYICHRDLGYCKIDDVEDKARVEGLELGDDTLDMVVQTSIILSEPEIALELYELLGGSRYALKAKGRILEDVRKSDLANRMYHEDQGMLVSEGFGSMPGDTDIFDDMPFPRTKHIRIRNLLRSLQVALPFPEKEYLQTINDQLPKFGDATFKSWGRASVLSTGSKSGSRSQCEVGAIVSYLSFLYDILEILGFWGVAKEVGWSALQVVEGFGQKLEPALGKQVDKLRDLPGFRLWLDE